MVELVLHIRQIYHDWFKDEDDLDNTAATPGEIDLILSGRQALPPGAIVHFDVGVNGADSVDEIPIPLSLKVEMSGPEKNMYETFTPGSGKPEQGELGKMKPGKWNRSKGYNGLFVTEGFNKGPHKMTLRVYGAVNGVTLESAPVLFPWVAKNKK